MRQKDLALFFLVLFMVPLSVQAQSFPQDVDFMVRALAQKLPIPLKLKSVTVNRDLKAFSSSEITYVENNAMLMSQTSSKGITYEVNFVDQSNRVTTCLGTVVRDSTYFNSMTLGEYSDRVGTVIIEACKNSDFRLQYNVILNLDKALPYSSQSTTQAFTAIETMNVNQKKFLCIGNLSSAGVPHYAVAAYETPENIVVGLSIEPTGEVTVSDKLTTEIAPGPDFPVGLEGMQDIDTILLEALPTLEFYRSFEGRLQIVFSKSECEEEGFSDNWPVLFCKARIPQAHRRQNIQEIQFRFAKKQITTRYQGQLVNRVVFETFFDFISSELNHNELNKRYQNTLLFEAPSGEEACRI